MSLTSYPILRNFSFLAAAQVISALTGIITVAIVARALGPEAYGILGFSIAILAYLGLATNLGTDTHGVRQIAQDESSLGAIAGIALTQRTIMAVFCLLSLICTLAIMRPGPEVTGILLIQSIGLFFIAWNMDFALQGLQRIGAIAMRQIFAAVMVMIATFWLIDGREDLYTAAAIPAVVNLLSAGLLLAHFKRSGFTLQFGHAYKIHWDFLRQSLPVTLMGFLLTIHVNVDIILLGLMRPASDVGLYTAASRLFIMVLIVTGILQSVFLPLLSKVGPCADGQHAEAGAYAQIVCWVGGAVLIGGTTLSGPVLALLFGNAFIGVETALTILMVSAALTYLSHAYGTPILAWKSDRAYLKIIAIGAVVNFGLNIILIPNFGVDGAAIATLVAQSVILICLAMIVRAAFQLSHLRLMIKLIILASLIASPLVLSSSAFANLNPVVLFLAGCFAIGIYTGLACWFKIIRISKIRYILNPTLD